MTPRLARLTVRKQQIIDLVAEGKTSPEIARELGIAVATVSAHLLILYRMFGVRNRIELLRETRSMKGDAQ